VRTGRTGEREEENEEAKGKGDSLAAADLAKPRASA